MTDGPARRLADAIGRRGLTAPARLLADAHRPLDPLVSDIGAALGPMIQAVAGRRGGGLNDALARPGGLDRLIEALDRRPAGSSRADTR
ncbi:MAG TPA: hypothetical protein VI277_00775 [Candidatus Limnocylindria bacterium]